MNRKLSLIRAVVDAEVMAQADTLLAGLAADDTRAARGAATGAGASVASSKEVPSGEVIKRVVRDLVASIARQQQQQQQQGRNA